MKINVICTVHLVDKDTDSDEWIYTVNVVNSSDERAVRCRMLLDKEEVYFQVDTGSSVNMLHAKFANNIHTADRKPKMWNNTELSPLGKCRRSVINPKTTKGIRLNVLFILGILHHCWETVHLNK